MSNAIANPPRPAFTPPTERMQAFIRFMARIGKPVATVPTSYVPLLNLGYRYGWIADVRGTDTFQLTAAGQNVAKWIIEQDQERAGR